MFAIRSSIFILSTLFLFLFSSTKGISQNEKEEYSDVIALIKEKEFHKALDRLKGKRNVDRESADHLALKGFLYAQIGERTKGTEEKEHYFEKGRILAEKAIQKDEDHAFAHFAKAMVLGRMIEGASPREKLNHAKDVKKEADRALKEDSTLAGPHHILGRWHKNIADLSTLERWSVDFFLGTLPEASFEKALHHFKKAARLEPREALHFYEMGATHWKMGEKKKARETVRKAKRIAEAEGDEEILKRSTEFLRSHGD